MAYCISNTLACLGTDCENNIGGIRRAYITHFDEGLYALDTDGEEVSGMTSGKTWYEINFRKESGSFNSTLNVDQPNGINYVSTEINFVFARMETEKRLLMKAMALDDMAVVVEDCNGNFWAFGIDEPVQASAGTAATGTARGDANNYTLTFTDYYKTWPVALSEAAVTALKGLVNCGTSQG